jgi:hypothetical protein
LAFGPLASHHNVLGSLRSLPVIKMHCDKTQKPTTNKFRVQPDIIEIGKVLLQAGAKLHLEIVRRALEAHNMPGLAYGLVSSVSDSDHSYVPANAIDEFLKYASI